MLTGSTYFQQDLKRSPYAANFANNGIARTVPITIAGLTFTRTSCECGDTYLLSRPGQTFDYRGGSVAVS